MAARSDDVVLIAVFFKRRHQMAKRPDACMEIVFPPQIYVEQFASKPERGSRFENKGRGIIA